MAADWWSDYNRYLKSPSWARTRKAALRRSWHRCSRCWTRGNRFNPLQAHHISYDRYNASGSTPVEDVQVLCYRCHRKVTAHHLPMTHAARGLLITAAILFGLWWTLPRGW
jgi:5-methylcytosine-specific restriction endonuclease McrA